jgi:HK97 family phage portal protein
VGARRRAPAGSGACNPLALALLFFPVKLRSIRPPDDITPNPNDPASVPPSTVGPDQLVTPGDPDGVTIDPSPPWVPPPRIIPSAWSGWPADWWTPVWGGGSGYGPPLTDTAWMCIDLNASVLASMPPYLVGAAASLDTGWMTNPDPDTYTSWEEFAKQAFWDFQLGETFILATARYATGWPARFHVVPRWAVDVELVNGVRRYQIGSTDVSGDMLHIRYKSSVAQPRGIGPLEAGASTVAQDQALSQYAQNLATSGGVPPSILTHDEELTAAQSAALQQQWVTARQSTLGEPAVLSGGVHWQPTQINPTDSALIPLSDRTQARIAQLLGVPAPLVGIPVSDPQTYRNVKNFFDFHWRAGLRPKAQVVMAALSAWLLPRGTTVELNRDAYVEAEPLERAQTAQIYNAIRDTPTGPPVLSVEEIRTIERIPTAGDSGIAPPAEPAGA